jgi:hypothetical protein
MSRSPRRLVLTLCLLCAAWFAAVGAARPGKPASIAQVGVDVTGLSHVISHPYVPFSSIKRAVYAGYDLDDETKDTLQTKVVMTVRDAPESIAGAMTTVVEFTHFEQGAVVERSWKYLAQDASGAVFILGDKIDDIENGKVVGHVGQWVAGQKGARAGLYMPAAPAVGNVFEQASVPGVAESRSKVTKTAASIAVPAGAAEDCVVTDVVDPAAKARTTRTYCRDKGRVSESSAMHLLQLVELELRTPPPQTGGK